jgi:hypothetical protein
MPIDGQSFNNDRSNNINRNNNKYCKLDFSDNYSSSKSPKRKILKQLKDQYTTHNN